MTAPRLEDLITPLTPEQIEQTQIDVAQGLGLKVTNWNPVGVYRTLMKIFARTTSVYTAVIADMARSPFLSYAQGPWLKILAADNYGTDYYPALGAVGPVRMTNSTANVYPPGTYDVGSLVVENPVTRQTYRNTEPYVSAGNDVVYVNFRAENVGSQTTSQAGQITQLVTSITGVSVLNMVALIGTDEETDAALSARAQLSHAALSPDGPKRVHQYVLTSPDLNPTSVPITRVTTTNMYGTGHVISYIANAAGAPSVGDVAISLASVVKYCEPMCIINEVYGATPRIISIAGTVWVRAETLSDAEIIATLSNAGGSYIQSQPIGGLVIPPSAAGRLDFSMLWAKLSTSLASIVDLSLTLPSADLVIGANEVLQLGTVTFNVVRV